MNVSVARIFGLVFGLGFSAWLFAAEPARIAIIIDDLGYNAASNGRAIALPGPLTYAVLPHAPLSAGLAEQAFSQGKEVMLHLPMQAISNKSAGPGVLTVDMSQADFLRSLDHSLESVPHVSGVNNHMGSLLTQHPGAMEWLMQALAQRGDLYFVDSRTSDATVAEKIAIEQQVPVVHRDVFLDHERDTAKIQQQLERAIRIAKESGSAVVIGHPYTETLQVLEQHLASFPEYGVELVSLSELLTHSDRRSLWRASLSPSLMDVKN